MQDQVHDRIQDLMNDDIVSRYDWDEIFQNAATFTFVTLFIALGISW